VDGVNMTIHFTNDWPTNALDWAATIGFGLVLGTVLSFFISLVINNV